MRCLANIYNAEIWLPEDVAIVLLLNKWILYMRGVIVFLLPFLLLTGCFESEYTRLVKAELSKETRSDSLLFNIKFGDSREEFYQKCYILNRRQLVSQGPGNSSVQYLFIDSIYHKEPASLQLLFYPKFDETHVIKSMDLELSYTGWAPWNTKLKSDSLKPRVLEMLRDWYGGNDFINVTLNKVEVPVKLDSNRRIIVFTKDEEKVVVKIQDILHPQYQHSVSK